MKIKKGVVTENRQGRVISVPWKVPKINISYLIYMNTNPSDGVLIWLNILFQNPLQGNSNIWSKILEFHRIELKLHALIKYKIYLLCKNRLFHLGNIVWQSSLLKKMTSFTGVHDDVI